MCLYVCVYVHACVCMCVCVCVCVCVLTFYIETPTHISNPTLAPHDQQESLESLHCTHFKQIYLLLRMKSPHQFF